MKRHVIEIDDYSKRVIELLNDEFTSNLFAVSLFTSDNPMSKADIINRLMSINKIIHVIELFGDKIKDSERWLDIFKKAVNINKQDWRELYGEDFEGIYAESCREQSSSNDE